MSHFCEVYMSRVPKAASGTALGVRIGQNIRSARTQMGLTQGQLAEALDIENVTMSRIETGAQIPSITRLQQVADILGTTLSMLVAEAGENSATAILLADVIDGLPPREQNFVRDFVLTYARHWKSGQGN